jgi:AcrR family transcriptional regulator
MAYVRAAEREQQIVAAAIRVLGDVGVPNTTLRGVAAAADVPLGTLHYVFPSKDKLLRAVIAAVIDDVLAAVGAHVDVGRGVAHAMRHGVTTFWTTLVEGEIGLQIMQYELELYSARTEGPGGLAHLQYERYTTLIADFCERAAHDAGERCAVDFGTLARLSLALVDGLILQYIASPDDARARRDLDRAVDMVLVLADPRPIAVS